MGLGAAGNDAGQGGFAYAWGAPEDHGGGAVFFDETAQDFARAQKMLLAAELGKGLGAHAGGQGGVLGAGLEKGLLGHGRAPFCRASTRGRRPARVGTV